MTRGELIKLLENVPDDQLILIPANPMDGFTGAWFSPCVEESGTSELGLGNPDEEYDLILNPPQTENAFCLVPCGFFELQDHHEKTQLN